ncbi:MAG TPA: PgaD family protein [Terriglobales bacterium]|jgi:poly-beta-1,6-N-acetyl-D-glucosamine biosynthesis protein PgaD|nr:PgaD family protein [Terriglobales bacterium]
MNANVHVPPAPPLIQAKRLPAWLVFRDILLTVVAWIAIAQSMRYGLYLFYDYFSPPVFSLTHVKPVHVVDIWNPLSEFLLAAICLAAWLAFWAFRGTRRLRQKREAPQPIPLPTSEHAHYFGMKSEELALWKTYRIAIVTFNADNHIAGVLRRDLESTVATASSRR